MGTSVQLMRLINTLAFILCLQFSSIAADVNASSCSQANVSSAISSASAGDRVLVPSGNCSWSGLSISKGVTIVGAGIGITTITLTGNNSITKQASHVTRIEGFSFSKSGGGNESKGWTIDGAWQNTEPVIFTGNDFTISGTGLFLLTTVGGVIIANNAFTGDWDDSFIQPKADGDTLSWTTADTFGDRDTNGKLNHYIETNTFYGGTNQGIDADDASRVVYRYNTLTYSSFNSHGWDTSPIGVRHFEIYNNSFVHNGSTQQIGNQSWSVWIRGGTGFIYNNDFDDIAGGFWGDKVELLFSIRGAEDARPQGACGSVSYPVPHQLGQSHNGTTSTTDPIRWYGNTGTMVMGDGWNWGNPCSLNFNTFWQSGRDYVIGTAKPGYAAYTYPHSLLGESEPAVSSRSGGAARIGGGARVP